MPGHGDVWFADGSKSDERSGTGYYSRRDGKGTCMSLRQYATELETEVIALMGCALRLENLNAGGRDMRICSEGTCSMASHSWLVGECKEVLERVAERYRLCPFLVLGYTLIRGNGTADRRG